MKTTISVVTAIALVTGTMLSAPAAAALQKTKTKSNNTNERALKNPSSPSLDAAKHCAMGTHIKDAVLTRGAGAPPVTCDATIVETEMTDCTTGTSDWSWGTSQSASQIEGGVVIFRDDGTAGDRVTTTNADANSGRTYATPHLAVCSALQKATMAINSDPEKLTAVQAKVSMQDFSFVRQMLIDNGVPAEMLPEVGDANAKASKGGWNMKENVKVRMKADGQAAPLQISMDWTQERKNYVGHVTLIK